MAIREMAGINALDDEAAPLTPATIDTAINTPWPTDAHFLPYWVVGAGSDIWPRINKPALGHLRAKGADVLTQMIVLDIDNKDHEPLTKATRAEGLDQFMIAAEQYPLVMQWHCLYTSKCGFRLIYLLDEPIRVDECEARTRAVIQAFIRVGILADKKCFDWSRCFRLPRVQRVVPGPTAETSSREDTEASPCFLVLEEWQRPRIKVASLPFLRSFELDPDTPGRGEIPKYAAPIILSAAPMPRLDDALSLIRTFGRGGQMLSTPWYQKAKQRLKGRNCYNCLFNNEPLADKGDRDNTLHAYLGAAVSLLMEIPETTEEHIYGLFADPVQQLTPDAGTPDWLSVLWSGIKRLWAKEKSKQATRQQVEAQQKKQEEAKVVAAQMDAEQLCRSLLDGVQKWCKDTSFLHAPAGEELEAWQMQWICRHCIVSHLNTYYLIRPDGWFDPSPVGSHQLLARIRITGLDKIIETERPGQGDVRMVDLPVTTLIAKHATIVSSVRAVPQLEGGMLENTDQTGSTLIVNSFRRNPKLSPQYDQDVDNWLKALFGEYYPEMNHWISWAMAFDEGPICALSIEADPGVGKKLLTQGFAETLENPCVATGSDLTGQYQYGILESPFLVINEGWPPGTKGKHPADMFREIVSGDTLEVNRRYLAPVRLSNPMRIFLTANNCRVVDVLAGGRDLSPEDRAALAIRLKHIKLGSMGARHLRAVGGLAHTAQKGRRWIKGDGGEPSDFVVARHFLWLHANRKGPLGTRLLVEGDPQQQVIEEMRMSGGATPLVIECLCLMIEQKRERFGLIIDKGSVFVVAAAILEYWRNTLSASARGEKLTLQKINDVLRSLVVEGSTRDRYEHPARKAGRHHWHEIDLELLLRAAQKDGFGNDRLSLLLSEQYARRQGMWIEREPKTVGPVTVVDSVPALEPRLTKTGQSRRIIGDPVIGTESEQSQDRKKDQK